MGCALCSVEALLLSLCWRVWVGGPSAERDKPLFPFWVQSRKGGNRKKEEEVKEEEEAQRVMVIIISFI